MEGHNRPREQSNGVINDMMGEDVSLASSRKAEMHVASLTGC